MVILCFDKYCRKLRFPLISICKMVLKYCGYSHLPLQCKILYNEYKGVQPLLFPIYYQISESKTCFLCYYFQTVIYGLHSVFHVHYHKQSSKNNQTQIFILINIIFQLNNGYYAKKVLTSIFDKTIKAYAVFCQNLDLYIVAFSGF